MCSDSLPTSLSLSLSLSFSLPALEPTRVEHGRGGEGTPPRVGGRRTLIDIAACGKPWGGLRRPRLGRPPRDHMSAATTAQPHGRSCLSKPVAREVLETQDTAHQTMHKAGPGDTTHKHNGGTNASAQGCIFAKAKEKLGDCVMTTVRVQYPRLLRLVQLYSVACTAVSFCRRQQTCNLQDACMLSAGCLGIRHRVGVC